MGIGNFGNMMKVMNAWNTFKQNHPKFPAFCSAVSKRGIREGSILEVTYISPEGEKLTTNIKVQASDIELLRQISGGNYRRVGRTLRGWRSFLWAGMYVRGRRYRPG